MRKTKSIKFILIVLVLTLIVGVVPTFAWNMDDLSSTTWPYLNPSTGASAKPYGELWSIRDENGVLYSVNPYHCSIPDIFPVLTIPKGSSSVFTPAVFYSDSSGTQVHSSSFSITEEIPADFSKAVSMFVRTKDGRGYPMFAIAENYMDGVYNSAQEINSIIDYSVAPLLDILKQYNQKMEDLYIARQSPLSVGDYHPVHANMLYYIGRKLLGSSFGSQTSTDNFVNLFTDFDCFADNAEAELRTLLERYGTQSLNGITQYSLSYYKALLETVLPFYLNYVETNRIASPVIESFSIGSSKGIVDREERTIHIRFPESTDREALPEPDIETTGWIKVKQVAGTISSGTIIYSLTPYEESTGVVYDGVRGAYGLNLGADLSALWKIKIEKGDPYNLVTAFAIKTSDGVLRQASIDEDNKTITLNLPVGTDLTCLTPVIDHTGTNTSMDGGNIDFTSPQTLTVYNSEYELETEYQVTVTSHESPEKDILSFAVDGAFGTINGTDINVTIPYATDLSNALVDIDISEFATITQQPDQIAEGTNIYTVQAEDGSEKTYTVTVIRTPAATGCSIESFRYGSVQAEIDEANGTVSMTLPAGTSLTFAPEVQTSAFAKIEPSSGAVRDFSNPVTYTVTAENGRQKTYTVIVAVSGASVDNEYRDTLRNVVGRIINRYHSSASDDWEWMDLGFYQNMLENTSDGFSIENMIGTLDCSTNVAMTNISRKLMTLTARGFDCTKLSKYHDGQPYLDRKGNEIDDLVSIMYNYSGSYTINGPTFALLALDMGNYTIPEDAVWTRENLIEVLLNHVYLSDNFGTDMVAAIMYALAPYRDDPELGERVRAKIDEGLTVLIQNMNPSDYTFKAWGSANSETASWVIMALTSIGIDPYTDPRFSDGNGKNVIQNWVDNYVNESGGYFHHTSSVTNNAMATYEGCYAAQWYLDFLDNGGAGHPYSLYYHRFDFSSSLSSDASILSFTVEGKQGIIEVGEENTISVNLSKGMPLTNVTPEIVFADGAKLVSPSLPVTFTEEEPQSFVVCAEDGKTYKTYFVTIHYDDSAASGADLDINSINLKNSTSVEETILSRTITIAEDGATEILLTVNPRVDTSRMYIRADVSYAASCSPLLDGTDQMDLSSWQTVTVTSEDSAYRNIYRIKVVAKGQAEITSFRVQASGSWYSGEIDNGADTIVVRNVDDTKLTSTALITDIDFTGRTCSPTSGLATDFSVPATFTLGGDAELASHTYTVKVLNQSGEFISAKSSGEDPSGGSSLSQQLWDAVMEESDVVDHQTSYVGWINLDGTWYYAQGSGAFATGWLKDGSTWYYLNPETCAMMTGWVKVNGTWYYMKDSGAMATGWVKDGDTWYYMNSSGAMVTDWVTVNNTWYYMKSSGAMAASEWVTGYYWIGASGAWTYQPKGSWKQNSTGWWFGDTSGWYAKNETIMIGGKPYTFNAAGYWVQ